MSNLRLTFTQAEPVSMELRLVGMQGPPGSGGGGGGGPIDWDDVENKPTSFPPSAHGHAISDVLGLGDALDGKAPTSHGHAISDVTGLGDALDGKAPVAHGHAIGDVSGLAAALDGKAPTSHGHAISDVTGLGDALDGKAPASHGHTLATDSADGFMSAADKVKLDGLGSGGGGPVDWDDIEGKPSTFPPSAHNHAIDDVTGLEAALDGKAPTSHGHAISDVTGLGDALDSKAPASHGHAIGDVSGLGDALDGKAPVSHGHAIGDVTGLTAALDSKAPASHGHAIGDVTGLGAALDGKAALSASQAFTGSQRVTPVALTDAATIAVDASLGNNFTLTLAGNRTLGNPTNVSAGMVWTINVTQDGTGGRTLGFASNYKFAGGVAPTLTAAAGARDKLICEAISATVIDVVAVKDFK